VQLAEHSGLGLFESFNVLGDCARLDFMKRNIHAILYNHLLSGISPSLVPEPYFAKSDVASVDLRNPIWLTSPTMNSSLGPSSNGFGADLFSRRARGAPILNRVRVSVDQYF